MLGQKHYEKKGPSKWEEILAELENLQIGAVRGAAKRKKDCRFLAQKADWLVTLAIFLSTSRASPSSTPSCFKHSLQCPEWIGHGGSS
jgi:hypothetical protein